MDEKKIGGVRCRILDETYRREGVEKPIKIVEFFARAVSLAVLREAADKEFAGVPEKQLKVYERLTDPYYYVRMSTEVY